MVTASRMAVASNRMVVASSLMMAVVAGLMVGLQSLLGQCRNPPHSLPFGPRPMPRQRRLQGKGPKPRSAATTVLDAALRLPDTPHVTL
jgi:hypothetical protein